MKNVINEKPQTELSGRTLASINYVNEHDIKDKNVIDIGCGNGWCGLNFLSRGVKDMTMCEKTENDLKTAKEYIKDKRVHFIVANVLKLPFPDNTFDTAVSWEVLEHLPKNRESKMFNEIKRILKPQGKLYLSTPNTSLLSNIFDPAWWLIGHRHYSKKELEKYVIENNMSVEDIQIRGRFWAITDSLNMYVSKWILRREKLFKVFFNKRINIEYSNSGYVDIFIIVKK